MVRPPVARSGVSSVGMCSLTQGPKGSIQKLQHAGKMSTRIAMYIDKGREGRGEEGVDNSVKCLLHMCM